MNFSKRKVFLDSLIYTLLPKLSFVASILILPWISPYLSLLDYGIYGLVMSYVAVFQVFSSLGQGIVLQNSFFTHKKDYRLIWSRSLALMTVVGILSSLVFLVIIKFTLAGDLGENLWIVIGLVSIYLILSPIENVIVNYYTLNEKSLQYACRMAIVGLITTIVTFYTIKYLKLGYLGWIISLPLSMVLMNLLFAKRIYKQEGIIPKFKMKKSFVIYALKIGLPLTPHQLSLYVLGISDRLLLDYFKIPIRQIGFYSQGYNLGSQANVIVNGVFQAFAKKIQEGFRGQEEIHRLFIRRMLMVLPCSIAVILFLSSIWAKEIFLILFNNVELQQAYPVTILVLTSYMFWSIYTFFTYPLSIQGKTFSISKITLAAAMVNLIGNLIFIPKYGIWASLIVTYISYIIFGFAGLLNKENRIFLNKYVNIIKFSIVIFCINLGFMLLAYEFRDATILIKLIVTLCISSFFVILYKKNIF